MNSLTEAFLKYDFVIKYKKGSEMPPYFLSRNAIEKLGFFFWWKEIRTRTGRILPVHQKHMHTHKNNCNCKHLEVAESCFAGSGILWKRIIRHGKHKSVIIAPKSLRSKISRDTHRNVMTGHQSKNKTKEIITLSCWWPSVDTEIEIQINSCDKCQRTRKCKRRGTMSAHPKKFLNSTY